MWETKLKQRHNGAEISPARQDHGGDAAERAAQDPARYDGVEQRRPGPRRQGYERLTGRERWIVSQLVKHKGAPNKVIAYALQISPNTLRNHLASIYAKLGVRRRVELVLYAMERGVGDAADR